jgi:AraC family transcriptional regulator, alkane utilization regulator
MTGKPAVLSESPEGRDDPLSDLLGTMHLSGTLHFRARFREPWSVITPASWELKQVLPFRTDYVIPFHVIAEGRCQLRMPEGEPVWVSAGDAVLLPHGQSHLLEGRNEIAPVHLGQLVPPPPWHNMVAIEHGGSESGEATGIICGFVQCDELLIHPLVRHLPPLIHVSPDQTPADAWLASTIRHTAALASNPEPGSRGMLRRLAELVFVEILRKHMQSLSAEQVGWFAAFHDPVAGAALRCLHAAPLRDWSVDSLSRHVGVSRTVLADRFRRYLDTPPMQYLARWRLQIAAQELKTSDVPLKSIAEGSGYESEAAFNRAFKRHFGLPPGDWRRRQGQTK